MKVAASHLARIRKAAIDWTLPPAVKRALVRQRARFRRMSFAERSVLAANARLQDAYSGRRCFVIANGPSLADVDIGSLGGEVTIVMNAFNQHPSLASWQPTVHCAAEPADFYEGDGGLEFLRERVRGYSSTTHVFPIKLKVLFDRTGILPRERLAFFGQDGRPASAFNRIDLTGPIPAPHDTSILAVSVALAMGCDPIILLGLDYNWLSHRSINRHFYDDGAMPWAVEDMSNTPYLEVMKQSVPCWEAHAALGRIAARNGQTIINATEGSFLDVYPRLKLDEAMRVSRVSSAATISGS